MHMSQFMAELIGTALLILLGNGVVANVVLKALTTLASGRSRWTRSPSESCPEIESLGGNPPGMP